ncbi:MAG: universal stress protein [Cyclobacteriaceae bacterium]
MNNIKGILIPTDFSPTAWQAVLAGIRLAKTNNCPVNLIHISPESSDKKYLNELRVKLQNIAKNLSGIYGIAVESLVVEGEPWAEIEKFIESLQIDMVVMGLNGTGGNEIGSLTGYVMHHLNCPVMVVPSSKDEKALVYQ